MAKMTDTERELKMVQEQANRWRRAHTTLQNELREAYRERDLHVYASGLVGHDLDRALVIIRDLLVIAERNESGVVTEAARAFLKEHDDE